MRSTLNPGLSIHGVVLTMFDSRNNLSNQVVADVREFMGKKVYDTMIPLADALYDAHLIEIRKEGLI